MVTFQVTATTTASPDDIVDSIFEVANWTRFQGWGPIPGVVAVEMYQPADSRIGTVFKVKNSDGSSHEERVIEWVPNHYLTMRMDHFSRPLNKIADYFIERWRFQTQGGRTFLEREFELHPREGTAGILLRPIAYLLKKAIQRHTAALTESPG